MFKNLISISISLLDFYFVIVKLYYIFCFCFFSFFLLFFLQVFFNLFSDSRISNSGITQYFDNISLLYFLLNANKLELLFFYNASIACLRSAVFLAIIFILIIKLIIFSGVFGFLFT